MIIQKKFKILLFAVAMLVFGVALTVVPSNVNAEVKRYYTYHNDLGGRVLTDCDLGVDFMEEYFSLWIYDGEREWDVYRVGFGFYNKYEYQGCTLYTNSISVKTALRFGKIPVPMVPGYHCQQLDFDN